MNRTNLRILFFSAIVLVVFISISSFVFSLQIPSRPNGRVNDDANLLDASSKAALESKLRAFEEETSNQVVVATFPSLEGESLEDFSMRLAQNWKIGQKGKDNGVILLIFKNDRKLRIEVGYGLEGALTDALSRRIIQDDIVPEFKKGNYAAGILKGSDSILAAIKGEYKPKETASDEMPSWLATLFTIILLIVFPLFLLYALIVRPILRFFWPSRFPRWSSGSSYSSYSGSHSSWTSGTWGSGGGGFSGGGGSFGGGGSSGSW